MHSDVFFPLIFFGFLGAVIIYPRYLKSKEREKTQDTIRAAIEKGQPLPSEVLDAMTRDVRPAATPGRDFRVGIVWLAIALGLAGFGVAMGRYTDEAMFPFLGIAAIPGAIGLAFILLSLFNKERR